jgi:hypothetical protein
MDFGTFVPPTGSTSKPHQPTPGWCVAKVIDIQYRRPDSMVFFLSDQHSHAKQGVFAQRPK